MDEPLAAGAAQPVVGVDIGGTKVLGVVLGDDGGVAARTQLAMPGRDVAESVVEDTVSAVVDTLAAGRRPAAVGVAAAGLVDASRERLRFAAHLPWRDAPLRRRFADRWGVPVVLDNDANCAAYAESVAGAATGASSVLLITLGTGIGGAFVLDGRVVRGANGMAGEFGHVQVVPDGLPCECGLRGCWEQYCSGRALERVMRVSFGSHLDGPEISQRAHAGDRVARGAFDAIGTWLGVGIAGLVSSFDPEVVVVGGGVVAGGDLVLAPARTALVESLQAAALRTVPPVVPAGFGPEAGAVGAALLARSLT